MPGPMARSVRDVALLLDALTGSSAYASAVGSLAADDITLGVANAWLSGHVETDTVFLGVTQALFEGGITLVTSEVTHTGEYEDNELVVLVAEMLDDMDAYLADRFGDGAPTMADIVEFNRANADTELAFFGQELLEMALASGGRAGERYEEARRICLDWAVARNLQAAFDADDDIDLLVAPAYCPAWKSDLTNGDHFAGGGLASPAPSMAGWPVLCLPMGFVDGLPVGLTLIGRPAERGDAGGRRSCGRGDPRAARRRRPASHLHPAHPRLTPRFLWSLWLSLPSAETTPHPYLRLSA